MSDMTHDEVQLLDRINRGGIGTGLVVLPDRVRAALPAFDPRTLPHAAASQLRPATSAAQAHSSPPAAPPVTAPTLSAEDEALIERAVAARTRRELLELACSGQLSNEDVEAAAVGLCKADPELRAEFGEARNLAAWMRDVAKRAARARG